ncbi:unnamed protein product [Hyaloperonospora brassicae]|uniref:Uncharacterized protein n=1 Tax=Hyaloperonospora brassicae TaxID=162125 RepID=A0AAV0TF31_HYABA|nr:unnamed protein product [Hyaloperonospora brassicae]
MRPNNDSQKLIVAGLPKSLDKTQLAELFSAFGTVLDASVVLDAATNASRGFGFVTFSGASALRAAIKGMHRKVLEGRTLNVRQLVPKDEFQSVTPEVGQRPCWLLRKGRCKMGANCLFSHDVQDGDCGSCFEFVQTGACRRGDKCKFAHVEAVAKDGLEVQKDSAGPTTRVCYSFQNGRCHRGKKCLYVHEKLEKEDVTRAVATTAKTVEETNRRRQKSDSVLDGLAGKKATIQQQQDVTCTPLAEKNVDATRATAEKEAPIVSGPAVHGNKFRQLQKANARTQQQERVKKAARPKVFEWKAKVTRARTEPDGEAEQDRGLHVMAPERPVKKVKREKIDMGAAFDGVSDDENDRSRKTNVDKQTLRANRDKLTQERRLKRSAKKNALSKLQTEGEVVLSV